MATNTRRGFAQLFISFGTFLAILASVSGVGSAQPATTPSLLLEGKGRIAPSSPECGPNICSGTLTASLTGRPYSLAKLTLNLSVNEAEDTFTGCHQVLGSGGIDDNSFNVTFVGQLCTPSLGYTLSGTVQIYSTSTTSTNAAVGTLLSFGGTNIPPNPVPSSGPRLVSIVGASGTIPLLLP
jgi:hypothetical protein